MSLRKARIAALAVAVFLTLLVVPMSAPVQAHDNSPVSICAVVGAVDVSAAGQLPPGASTPGTYTFFDVAIVCAGGLTGSAGATSSGSTSTACGAPPFGVPGTFGQFCGTYNTGAFPGAVAGNNCVGRVGGPGMWDDPGLIGPWSLTFGAVITGWIDCDHGVFFGDTAGAIALVAVPMALNTQASPANPDGGAAVEVDVDVVANNKDCADTGPADWPDDLPDDAEGELEGGTGEPQVWFCRILVGGVAVIAD